jgi:putative ABC transport system permease protein
VAEGQTGFPEGEFPRVRYYNIGPNYFRTLQVPVVRGREFSERDIEGAPPVAVVNETLAKNFWPDQDPIGKRLTLVREKTAVEVIGVVGDVKKIALDDRLMPEIYWPYMQRVRGASYIAIRTLQEPTTLAPEVRSRIVGVDPKAIVSRVSTMDQMVSSALKRPRFNVILLTIFAATALLLASVGLYGVMSYSVTERTKEIGIRMALGAERRTILRLVIGRGLTLTAAGIVIGLAVAFALTRLIASLLFGISATDPLTFGAIALLLFAIAMLACYVPARRATKVDPMVALRYE